MFNPLISISEFTEIISSYLVESWVMKKQDIGWESLDWKPREKVGKRSEETVWSKALPEDSRPQWGSTDGD